MTRWVFNEDGWTDWQQHDGKGCPCVGWWVNVEHCDGWTGEDLAADGFSWDWTNYPKYLRVIRYRVRKPKGAEMLEQLVQDVPEPVDA
jgi:hypothetical protein